MNAVLMDTHALIWLLNGQRMTPASRVAIAMAQDDRGLFASVVSAWEAALALTKPTRQPDLGGRDAEEWFRAVLALPGTRLVSITRRITLEAAKVRVMTNLRDPMDCFLVATARVKRVPVVTRDSAMNALAIARPDYLQTVPC
jgi:PIN domain nuclease of toxin-antitoxin system